MPSPWGGKERTLLRLAGSLSLQDVAPDGRVLLTRALRGWETAGLFPGDSSERDYSWLDMTIVAGLSPDGKMLAFQEGGEGGGPFQASYLRKTDGSAAVRLGDGFPMSLSEDGRFVVAAVDSPPPRRLVLIPTGAGESRTLPRGSVDKYQWALFAPEGTRIMFTGHEAGRPRRGFIQELPDGLPRAVTPEGTRVFAFSPDGQILAASSDLSSWALYPTEGGAPRPLPWLRPGETPIRWGLDPQSLYVRETATPARISRLDLRTGRRQPWRELMPNDRAGVLYVWMVQMTSDGHYYAYSYPRELSDLYLVEGLQ